MQKKLASIRRYHNISQREMANLIGVTERAYHDKENGKTQFKANEMFAIARRFQMTIEEIFLDGNFENHEVLKGEVV